MRDGKIILSFDIEEFDLPEEYGATISGEEKYSVSIAGAETILNVINSAGARVTFFVTANFAERAPELVRRMAERHEIASHGVSHSKFEIADLAQSRSYLRKLTGQEVTGFRMARLAAVEPEQILEAGYTYESSINPCMLPGRYNHLDKPVTPYHEKCGLVQLPISVFSMVRFPLFWLSFKNLPLGLYLWMATNAIRRTGFFNMYSHPWEYNSVAAESRWKIPGYVTRHAGAEQARRLATLLAYLGAQADFATFSEFLKGRTNENF
ncbi:MAG: polysaccharide deacetylase family protein [Victivallaceae bacterium]|nr:polysaccharide deacetylase family protein [Victivallaceae bacterium]